MNQIWNSLNRAIALRIIIKCKGVKKFRCFAEDLGKRNSKYVDRLVEVRGEMEVIFSFPVTPKQMFLGFLNAANLRDQDFYVSIEEIPLKTYDIWIDEETRNFYKLSIYFSQVEGFTSADPKGTLFKTDDDKFNILLYPVIRDGLTGNALNTPARIGHKSGKIDASKVKMDRYTEPMRVAILGHEFAHKYRNPKIGLEISNEIGADINMLYVYLGLGFSKVDAICVFAKVFLKAQTPSNIERMRKIMDYIDRFEKGEFAKPSI